jgi:hypothetical protein
LTAIYLWSALTVYGGRLIVGCLGTDNRDPFLQWFTVSWAVRRVAAVRECPLFAPLLGAKRTSISVVAAGLLTLKSTIW